MRPRREEKGYRICLPGAQGQESAFRQIVSHGEESYLSVVLPVRCGILLEFLDRNLVVTAWFYLAWSFVSLRIFFVPMYCITTYYPRLYCN